MLEKSMPRALVDTCGSNRRLHEVEGSNGRQVAAKANMYVCVCTYTNIYTAFASFVTCKSMKAKKMDRKKVSRTLANPTPTV